MSNESGEENTKHPESFISASFVWLKIGLISFGGPAAQIALMHRELVQQRQWLGESRFLNSLSFCMLLPGPEAMQLATYSGWRLYGIRGGLVAGLLFVIPGAIAILLLAMVYKLYGDLQIINALFIGVKAAVLVIVIEALIKLSKRTMKKPDHLFIAILAFTGIFFFQLPFPLIVFAAAAYGFLRASNLPANAASQNIFDKNLLHRSLRIALIGLLLWWLPVLILWLSGQDLLTQVAMFFSKLAVVTFGGAYAVLAYMAQDVVTQHGWLTSGEMMDGLGLAETTPGPLILVNEFVAYVAGFNSGGPALANAAACTALWVTFVPCFIWIFVGAPFIDWLSSRVRLKSALEYISVAVVGVIANLSLWFALHVFFSNVTRIQKGPLTLWQPELSTLSLHIAALFILASALLLWRHWNVLAVLLVVSLAGLLLTTA